MREELIERFLKFAVQIYKLESMLCKTYSGRHVYGQLFRAGTSGGANYDEATAAESRQDFIHKMQLSLKELRESHYWLRFIAIANMVKDDNSILKFLLGESKELKNIIGKAIVTAKKNRG